jgi:EAL domain-containing protein (putative c-di-GMP-specific phosphodiesterase class I)
MNSDDKGLRLSNENYVAFAFAAADVLLETTDEGHITFAVGAAMPLTGLPARLLTEHSIHDLFGGSDGVRLTQALSRMAAGERVRNLPLTLVKPEGTEVGVVVSGYRSPTRGDRLLVAMVHGILTAKPEEKRAQPAGLLDKEAFAAVAKRLMENAPPGAPYHLTMLDLGNMEEFRNQAGSEAAECFTLALSDQLRTLSVGGDAVGQLSETKYGVIHDAELQAGQLDRSVEALSRAVAPDVAPVSASTASLQLDTTSLPPEEVARALAYTINSFIGTEDGRADMAALTVGLQPKLSATVRQMHAFREMVEAGRFEIVYQPLVDLWTNVIHHFECLVRFEGTEGASPYEMVTFGEDTGLSAMLDLAILERTVTAMRTGVAADPSLNFAVNLSGRTLSDPRAVARLRPVVAAAADLHKRLAFEMTESAEVHNLAAVNAVLQDIRGQGFHVCLDDFGAGAAAFHYLRNLKVDNVKIDGSYVRDLMKSNENVSFIKAIVALCGEMGITTTAEYVEDSETAGMLKVLKVRFGQGYYFGKPHSPQTDHGIKAAWTTRTTEWRGKLLYFKG